MMGILMTTDPTLRLMQWLSPSYPVGAFAYSHGLEAMVKDKLIVSATTLSSWLDDLLTCGGAKSDAVLLAAAYHAQDDNALHDIDITARAFCTGQERLMETNLQGEAFCQTTQGIWNTKLASLTYPIAIGQAAQRHEIDLDLTLRMYLHSFVSNLISAAQRLLPIGQLEGQKILAALDVQITTTAQTTRHGNVDHLYGACFASDIASMRHETQYSRIFRS